MVEKSGNDATYVGENEIWGDKEEKENIWKSTSLINVKKYEENRWSERAADSLPHTLLVCKILL